jgi:hypothetical protein
MIAWLIRPARPYVGVSNFQLTSAAHGSAIAPKASAPVSAVATARCRGTPRHHANSATVSGQCTRKKGKAYAFAR